MTQLIRQNRYSVFAVMWLYALCEWRSTLTCGSGKNPSLQEITDVEVAATLAFLPSVLLLLLFLPSTAVLSTGGGGKGLEADTLD